MPTLMVSISGIRGIIGDGLDPNQLVKFTSAFADFTGKGRIVIGRDARISGEMVRMITCGTLLSKGIDVTDIGIVPTPTVQLAVKNSDASGGIAITASHNPNEWNALKLLNNTGQFMSPAENLELLKILDAGYKNFESWENLGTYEFDRSPLQHHMDSVMRMKYINPDKIRKKKFRVVADCVNGAGVYVIPDLLRYFGCDVIEMNCEKTGIFPRLPEPLPENLTETMKAVKEYNADLGIVVDPDVDRLVLITENGEPFGEEYSIVQAVKFILSKEKGNVVVNLSTTRAADDICAESGVPLFRSPVGEANVVKKMKEVNALIGGEGSGGIIYPELHFGRDALAGIAITLQHLTEFDGTISELKKSLPGYHIVKRKFEIGDADPDLIIQNLAEKLSGNSKNSEDGLRIDYDDHWVHFRKSNTEPIIRIVTEAKNLKDAERYSISYSDEIKSLLRSI